MLSLFTNRIIILIRLLMHMKISWNFILNLLALKFRQGFESVQLGVRSFICWKLKIKIANPWRFLTFPTHTNDMLCRLKNSFNGSLKWKINLHTDERMRKISVEIVFAALPWGKRKVVSNRKDSVHPPTKAPECHRLKNYNYQSRRICIREIKKVFFFFFFIFNKPNET